MEIREQANYVEKDDRGASALLVQQGLGEKQENMWYLDTGASNHMCGYRELFGDLNETKQGLVTFGDTSKVPFKDKGSIPNQVEERRFQLHRQCLLCPSHKAEPDQLRSTCGESREKH